MISLTGFATLGRLGLLGRLAGFVIRRIIVMPIYLFLPLSPGPPGVVLAVVAVVGCAETAGSGAFSRHIPIPALIAAGLAVRLAVRTTIAVTPAPFLG